jgi:hypothetical protein
VGNNGGSVAAVVASGGVGVAATDGAADVSDGSLALVLAMLAAIGKPHFGHAGALSETLAPHSGQSIRAMFQHLFSTRPSALLDRKEIARWTMVKPLLKQGMPGVALAHIISKANL